MAEGGLVEVRLWRFKDAPATLGLNAWQEERVGTRKRLADKIEAGEIELATAYLPTEGTVVIGLSREEAELVIGRMECANPWRTSGGPEGPERNPIADKLRTALTETASDDKGEG